MGDLVIPFRGEEEGLSTTAVDITDMQGNTTGLKLGKNSVDLVASAFKIGGTAVTATAGELNTKDLTIHLTDISTTSSSFIVSPYAGAITQVNTIISGPIGTGNADLNTKINGVTQSTALITVTQSGSAAGDIDTANPTGTTLAIGDKLEIATNGASTNTVSVTVTYTIAL